MNKPRLKFFMVGFPEKGIFKIFFVFIFLLSIQNLFADPLFLTMPVEAKSQALGGAITARSAGATSLRYNPAGLGFTTVSEAELTHVFLGPEISGNSFQFTYPFAPYFSVGVFGTALYLTESFKKVENFQESAASLSMLDFEIGAAAGYELTRNFSAGLTMRYFRFQLGPEVGQSIGFDLGVLYKFNIGKSDNGYNKFAAGLAVKNIGPAYDYFGGGDQTPQPINVRVGLAYEGLPWMTPSFDYSWSRLEESSIHGGIEFLPNYIISPKMGITHDFSGISMSFGGGISYGKGYKFNMIGGTSLGTSNQTTNTFFSLLLQVEGIVPGRTENNPRFIPEDKISIENIEGLYQPLMLVPYNSGYQAEKIQGITLSADTAQGYKHRIMRLRRVALQPQDEKYLKRMKNEKITELILTKRKIGIWMEIESLPTEDEVGWWDSFSSIVEASANVEVMLGKNMDNLNKNPNAPLRVEFKLNVKYIKQDKKSELRTSLLELYGNSIVIAKNFTIYEEDNPFMIWQDVSQFYSEYLSQIDAYYRIKMKYSGERDI